MALEDDYFDLGDYRFAANTQSPAASRWISRGMVWLYGYNHEEAVVCFERAAQEDPQCLMAYWGIAFGIGPNYNKIWEMFAPAERISSLATAHKALEEARRVDGGAALERDLLQALTVRYPHDPETEDFSPYNDAFANAMRTLYARYPDQLDVACIFAEALMGRTPWQLWDLVTGEAAAGASTEEARAVIENAFANNGAAWQHPGLLHMYIHLMEMSPTPELALPHGDKLAELIPDSGHLLHMATHIDVLCGQYQNVISRNHKAAQRDRSFTALRGAQNFYTVYRIHNVHFEAYGAMFLAQKTTAMNAALELQQLLPEPIVAYLPDLFEAFWGMKTHVMVRFGLWHEILAEPLPENDELFTFTTALLRYARVIALANTEQYVDAAAEFIEFEAARANVQKSRFMFNNPASEVLKVAAEMAQGELKYKAGEVDDGLAHLQNAANLSDHLLYDEPWGWMQPPRHALAALLMEQQRHAEAEAIYRADLGLTNELSRPCQHPANVWSLHGLHECLQKRNEQLEIVHIRLQLDLALARAEVPIRASCYCRSSGG